MSEVMAFTWFCIGCLNVPLDLLLLVGAVLRQVLVLTFKFTILHSANYSDKGYMSEPHLLNERESAN